MDNNFVEHTESVPSSWDEQRKPQWFHYLLAGWKETINELDLNQKGFAVLVSVFGRDK